MLSKWLARGLFGFCAGLLLGPALAQHVVIKSLGSVPGALCWYDRAMLIQDPSGINILIQPGRTVNENDPRLDGVTVHAILLDHAHGDHMGDRAGAGCPGNMPGTSLAPTPSIVRIAKQKHSVVLAGGELAAWLNERLNDYGEAAADCGADPNSPSRIEAADRTVACTGVVRPGATRELTLHGEPSGVRISTVPASHSNGIDRGFIGGTIPPGTQVYGGTETGFVIRFSNGLSLYWSGDSGFFGDMRLFSQYYGVNLAILHIGDVFTMGPDEAAFAVNHLIKPETVIPTHVNEEATDGGSVKPGTKTARFVSQVKAARVIIPTSGDTITCDGRGRCTKH